VPHGDNHVQANEPNRRARPPRFDPAAVRCGAAPWPDTFRDAMARRCASFVAALAAPLALLGATDCASTDPEVAEATWHVAEGAIRDASGRSVVLRGVNFAGSHKWKPYFSDFGPADLARLRSDYGFNALRMLVLWAGLEPDKGVYDATYLDKLEERVRWASDAGLLVVLDMHQDIYGEGFAGGDGAPRWTCDEARYAAFKPTTPWFLGSLDPNVGACVDGLYAEGGEVRAHFVDAWRRVAMRLSKYENVIGFDILNEPNWGTYSLLAFEADRLASFYTDVARAVRAVAPTWLIFAEPGANRNVGYPSALPKLPFEGVVYAPHSYDRDAESGSGFDAARRDAILANLAALRAEADALGAALFIGEYGGPADDPGIVPYMDAQYDGAGAVAAGATHWAMDKGGGYSLFNADGSEKPVLADVLVRPYPARVTGALRSYAFDETTKTATIRWGNDIAVAEPTEIVVPQRVWPQGVDVECGGCQVEDASGLVRLRSLPPGETTVTLRSR
jgi:endoglycosylceramidase